MTKKQFHERFTRAIRANPIHELAQAMYTAGLTEQQVMRWSQEQDYPEHFRNKLWVYYRNARAGFDPPDPMAGGATL